MRSNRSGRGPSLVGGIVCICLGLFGVRWLKMVITSGNVFMIVFGIVLMVVAVFGTIYNFKNAKPGNRYSEFHSAGEGSVLDTGISEKADPWEDRYGVQNGGDIWDQITKKS